METMTCEQARALFDEKLDGVIHAQDGARLNAHLATCEACRREYEALEKTHAYLCSFAAEVPSELSANVMESIRKEPKRRATLLRRLRPLVALPVAALLCVALLHSPFFDGMFAAKSEVDMSAEAPIKNDFYLSDDLNGLDAKENADGAFDLADPEEIAPPYAANTIRGTSLTLHFTDERNALLVDKGNSKNQDVLYSRNGDVITIEKDGKKADLVLAGDTLTPTNKAALDALLSE